MQVVFKEYISHKLSQLSLNVKLLDAKSVLCKKEWTVFNLDDKRIDYFFKDDNTFLSIIDDDVHRGKWELLNENTLLISLGESERAYKLLVNYDGILIFGLPSKKLIMTLISNDGLKNKLTATEELEALIETKLAKDEIVKDALVKVKKTQSNDEDDLKALAAERRAYLAVILLIIFFGVMIVLVYT